MDMAETGTEEAVAGRVDTRLHSKLVPVAWMVKDWFLDNRYSWCVLGVAAGAGILSTALACHVMLVPGMSSTVVFRAGLSLVVGETGFSLR